MEAFASSVGKSGFVGQAKSMLSELFQYSVQSCELSESRKQVGEHTMLGKSLEIFRYCMTPLRNICRILI